MNQRHFGYEASYGWYAAARRTRKALLRLAFLNGGGRECCPKSAVQMRHDDRMMTDRWGGRTDRQSLKMDSTHGVERKVQSITKRQAGWALRISLLRPAMKFEDGHCAPMTILTTLILINDSSWYHRINCHPSPLRLFPLPTAPHLFANHPVYILNFTYDRKTYLLLQSIP